MRQNQMTRETRIGLFTFAALSLAVSCNLFLMQGRRVNNSVETAAILKPDAQPPRASASGPDAAVKLEPSTPANSVIVSPPQPATRPLPVAVAPPASSVSRMDMVRSIQRGLAGQGYEPGTADGLMGLMTHAAIMAYEADNGLALTAEPSEDLMRRVEQGPRPVAAQRKGPPEVKTLEAATLIRNVGTWLAAIGYPVAKTETSMSAALVRAIRDYEASQKMPETGRISAPLVARLSRAGQARAAAR
jgi:peptidoglycan hydrolase-like protein with peptidoglycan-binding domain